MFARNIHDDIIRGITELLPIRLRAELLHMVANRSKVRFQMSRLAEFVRAFMRVEKGVEAALRVDDQLAPAGKIDNRVGAQASFIGVHRDLCLEVGIR
jgi:hypothetical protein